MCPSKYNCIHFYFFISLRRCTVAFYFLLFVFEVSHGIFLAARFDLFTLSIHTYTLNLNTERSKYDTRKMEMLKQKQLIRNAETWHKNTEWRPRRFKQHWIDANKHISHLCFLFRVHFHILFSLATQKCCFYAPSTQLRFVAHVNRNRGFFVSFCQLFPLFEFTYSRWCNNILFHFAFIHQLPLFFLFCAGNLYLRNIHP